MKRIKPKANQIDKLNLKPNRKLGISNRSVDVNCPHCLSRLIIENNEYKCTAEKIFMLVNEFKLFSNLEQEEQEEYLNELDDPDTFLDLYDKWESNELDCVYNDKFFDPISNKSKVLDPLVVARVEQNLGRTLTEEEKANEAPIWTDGVNYFDEYDRGLILFKIPLIAFPEET